MALTIFDTDILIDVGRGDLEAINCLQNYAQTSTLAISVITKMELIVGCRDKIELRNLGKFFKNFQVLELNNRISKKSVEFWSNFV